MDQAPVRPERRQLTVLFCDLVGSTALSSRLDLEDFHDLVLAYQRQCARCIEESGGVVAQFAGDGVLAYFGFPLALEDAPHRAVDAALRIRDAVARQRAPDGGSLAVRAGIATGPVVIGELLGRGAASERAIAGETPNLASRLQRVAAPGGIVVSETTRGLCDGVFDFRPLGLVEAAGFSRPPPAFEVLGPRWRVRRIDARLGDGDGELFGREAEFQNLLAAWRAAKSGRRRVVGIVGEAGVGKSRLVEELRRTVAKDQDATWLEGGGTSLHRGAAFHVAAQFAPPLAAIGSIAASLLGEELAPPDSFVRPDRIAGLLTRYIGQGGHRPPDSAADRADLLDGLEDWLDAAAAEGPIVLAVEDLHWVDPSTLEFLERVAAGRGDRPLLFVHTSRPSTSPPWLATAGQETITLGPLNSAASARLARSAGGEALALGDINLVVARSAGVPLYIEELTRLVARGQWRAREGRVPASLADLLAAAVDELGAAKRHAQVAAVLGQVFPTALFAAMVEAEGGDPLTALSALIAAGFVSPARTATQAHAFRHAMIAAAAHDTLLRADRRELHHRAATLILEQFASLAEGRPETLAAHWAEAGESERAIAAWEEAGHLAVRRRAFREAELNYRSALEELDQAKALPGRDVAELRIRARFNRVLQLTQSFCSLEAAASAERAQSLAVQLGNSAAEARELMARWRALFTAGDFAAAARVADRSLDLTAAEGAALWRRLFALRVAIQHKFYTGDLEAAERAYRAWEAMQDGSHKAFGDDALSMGIGALIAWMRGQDAEAERRIGCALSLGERRTNAFDLAMALHCAACLRHFQRDPPALADTARRLRNLAADAGFDYAACLAEGWLAISRIDAGDAAGALQRIGEAMAGFRRLGARISLPFWLGVRGAALGLAGDHEGALAAYDEAVAYNPPERAFCIDILRGRADLLAGMGRAADAERDRRAGIELARRMGAVRFTAPAAEAAGRRLRPGRARARPSRTEAARERRARSRPPSA